MEKTYYVCKFTRGCPLSLNTFPSMWFNMCLGPLTVRLTDQRIFITIVNMSVFEAGLSEISLFKVKPDFMSAAVEVTLHKGGGYAFSINNIDGFFESLSNLELPVQGNEERIKRLFKIYYWLPWVCILGLILFIVSIFIR